MSISQCGCRLSILWFALRHEASSKGFKCNKVIRKSQDPVHDVVHDVHDQTVLFARGSHVKCSARSTCTPPPFRTLLNVSYTSPVIPTRSSMPRNNPNLNISTRRHQTIEYNHQCELCGLPCKTAGGLQRHKNARHGDSESEVRALYLKLRLKSLTIASLPHHWHPTSLRLCKKLTIYPSSIAT